MKKKALLALSSGLGAVMLSAWALDPARFIGKEVAVQEHLRDDEEFRLSIPALIAHGRMLFAANWTIEEGAGRPLTKGNGRGLSDPTSPLVGGRGFNRISGPDANSCAGCHNTPHSHIGGGGDFASNVFVLGQRFDFATFDRNDTLPTRGAVDENGAFPTLDGIANFRRSPGMFGGGYIEMLAREMTEELQRTRDGMARGETRVLMAKGVSFGRLTRKADGLWDTREVQGLSRLSLLTSTNLDPPTLVIRPWHQAGNSMSLRDFTNTSLNHHHGIQSTERFGAGTDPDGDGIADEITRADVTALAVFQATLPVPGRVIPRNAAVERAVAQGERLFAAFGCAACHVPALPLARRNWQYSEPSPYNSSGNLRPGEAAVLKLDLNDRLLPLPRLQPDSPLATSLAVPAYTDLKLHDISDPGDALPTEALDMNWPVWAPKFSGGNRKFLTRRLWGAGNSGPYFHHGLFTTMRQAVLAHGGEAAQTRQAFVGASRDEQDAVIEFLKSLQVLPAGTPALVVDEHFQPRAWPGAQPR